MENKEVCIKKIPLDNFINVLMELYNKGLDYVDIQGVTDNNQDRLAISFTNEYMRPGMKETDMNDVVNAFEKIFVNIDELKS